MTVLGGHFGRLLAAPVAAGVIVGSMMMAPAAASAPAVGVAPPMAQTVAAPLASGARPVAEVSTGKTVPVAGRPAAVARSVTVAVSGAPTRAFVMTVTGPKAFARTVTFTRTRRSVKLAVPRNGTYYVNAREVSTTLKFLYYPTRYRTPVVVSSKTPARKLTVVYKQGKLSFTGIATLRLGMTWAQAKAAMPSLSGRSVDAANCRWSSMPFGTAIFNPVKSGGRLKAIWLAPSLRNRTAAGLSRGDTYWTAQAIYGFTRTRAISGGYDPILVSPNYIARSGREATTVLYLEVHFYYDGDTDFNHDITNSTVDWLVINSGQRCYG